MLRKFQTRGQFDPPPPPNFSQMGKIICRTTIKSKDNHVRGVEISSQGEGVNLPASIAQWIEQST